MQGQPILGISMGVVAGLVNGIFLLPTRYARKWAWENLWLIFALLSTLLFPWVAARVAVPHLIAIFRAIPLRSLAPGLIAGTVWGIAQVLYGLGVGIAIGSTLIMCMAILADGVPEIVGGERRFDSFYVTIS